jgi:hypothetical protein
MIVVAWVAAAVAQTPRFVRSAPRGVIAYEMRWTGPDGTARAGAFQLSAAAVQAAVETPRHPDLRALATFQAEAIRAWAPQGAPGVQVTVQVNGHRFTTHAKSEDRDAMRAALDRAGEVADQARAAWLGETDAMVVEDGIAFDHAAFAVDAAAAVQPIAAMIHAPTARAWAAEALAFVQSIPYEERAGGGDTGFRSPLALIDRNRGDCDGKSALFLALLRAAHPDVPSAMVYIPRHALVAIGLPPEPGDDTRTVGKARWVLAQPVGPAALPLGDAGGDRGEARRGTVRVLPPVSPRP